MSRLKVVGIFACLRGMLTLDVLLLGEGVHMKASIEFYDERDLYANPNGEGRYRVERVRDLFTADEVEVRI